MDHRSSFILHSLPPQLRLRLPTPHRTRPGSALIQLLTTQAPSLRPGGTARNCLTPSRSTGIPCICPTPSWRVPASCSSGVVASKRWRALPATETLVPISPPSTPGRAAPDRLAGIGSYISFDRDMTFERTTNRMRRAILHLDILRVRHRHPRGYCARGHLRTTR